MKFDFSFSFLRIFPLLFALPLSLRADTESLREHCAPFFEIGTCVSPSQLHGETEALILRHFSSLTAENCMKPDSIYRADGPFNFAQADLLADFARKHGLKLRGHTLVWHSQTPPSFFTDENGQRLEKAALYARMEEWMRQMMSHFRGTVSCWDVVNEALADGGPGIWRTRSPWFEICGEEFVAQAFRTAHKLDPDAKLYYNDYQLIQPAKRERALKMLRGLLEAGVPIDGVGMQAHWNLAFFDADELQKSIDAFSELGLDVQITELDLSIYPIPRQFLKEGQTDANAPASLTPELEAFQAETYRKIFEIFFRNSGKISSVTFWGFSDRFSWLNYFPRRGRQDFPLLFDRNLQPKKAFDALMNLPNHGTENERK